MLDRHKRTADIDSVFWQQWQEHQDYLYHCCVRWMGGNSIEAEDVLSMAMLKAREKRQQSPKAIKNFKAWLTTLTYNLCLDVLKQRTHYDIEVEDVDLVISNGVSPAENPILAATQQELENFFGLAIDELPKRLRETFILYFEKQYCYQEIGTELNISADNVRKRISQARAILRKRYKEYNEVSRGDFLRNAPQTRIAPTVENSPTPELTTEIVVLEIPQEAVLSEEKSEPISVQATFEEELPEIETVENGEQRFLGLSVLVKLLKQTRQKPHFSRDVACNVRTVISYQLLKGFSQPLKLVNNSPPEYFGLKAIDHLITFCSGVAPPFQ